MKTTDELIKEHVTQYVSFGAGQMWIDVKIKNAMIEFAAEAIKECAERARTNLDVGVNIESLYVDKDSILNILKELK